MFTKNELKSYAKAGSIADEVLTAIRTVFAFNGAKKEHNRYEIMLADAEKIGIKKGFLSGAILGFFLLVIFCQCNFYFNNFFCFDKCLLLIS